MAKKIKKQKPLAVPSKIPMMDKAFPQPKKGTGKGRK